MLEGRRLLRKKLGKTKSGGAADEEEGKKGAKIGDVCGVSHLSRKKKNWREIGD